MRFLHYIFCVLLLSVVIVSCQKEEGIKDASLPDMQGNNLKLLALMSVPGNLLATSGTLTIFVKDSVYVFDAQKDSIAFVNLYLDNKRYFGITAINKEHNMSFGISSPGNAETDKNKDVAGSQFILSKSTITAVQYALTQSPGMQNSSNINLSKYAQDSTLVKGSFVVFLTPNSKSDSSFYNVRGQFDLKMK